MITKIGCLRKMINKKVFVISSIEKFEGYIGLVYDVKDENHLIIKSGEDTFVENIFDIRSMPYEF